MSPKPGSRSPVLIVPYDNAIHREQVIALWTRVFGYQTAHNEPSLAIDRKCAVGDDMIFIAMVGDTVVGTILAGYDGHRGWLYSLAVLPEHRHHGVGSALVRHAEEALAKCDCVKVNLQILESNAGVVAFYEKMGYEVEPRISMGKRLHG